MIELFLLFALFFAGATIFVGLSAAFLLLKLIFKAVWFGLLLLFKAGIGAVILAAVGLVLLVKFSGVLLLAAVAGGVVFLLWVLFGDSPRRPAATASAYDDYPGHYRGSSARAASIHRINSALDRLDRRMEELEAEMRRRGR